MVESQNMNLHDIEKPINSIEKVMAHFPVSHPFLMESGKVLPLKKKNDGTPKKIFFLLDGAFIASTGEGDKKYNLSLVISPAIIGLGQLSDVGACAAFESISPCLIDTINLEDFRDIIDNNNLWSDICQILLPSLGTLAICASTSGLQSAYEIIRSYLIYMDNEKSYSLKERYTVVKYMQTFSRLSRSMILKVLAELKIGGFIEMENGKLVKINRNLPEKF